MAVNEQNISDIQHAADIVEIISSYIPLTSHGKNYFGVCPFHDDHSPSMSVSKEKQIYKCFSCGAGGNVFNFVENYENVNFIEAVKIIADKVGINFTTNTKIKKNKNENLYQIMDLAKKFYQNNLNSSEAKNAKTYLKSRSIDENIIKDFELGLALKDKQALSDLLIKKKFTIKDLNELSLINVSGENIYDCFVNRIIFPIHDLEGRVVGFSGRIYEDSDQAKYFNSRESKIFKKGNILFNYHRARDSIKLEKSVILVEGNMDAIRLYENGIKNVVALMGTALTKEQIDIIKKLRVSVILMLDNDTAGYTATYNNGLAFEKAGINCNVVRISDTKDVDEYIIKNGVEALKNNLTNPISFLDFKLNYLKQNKNLNNLEDIISYVKEVLANLKDNDNELVREITLKKISKEYDIDIDILKNSLNITKNSQKEVTNVKKSDKVLECYEKAVQDILYFMMNDSKYIDLYLEDIGYFKEKKYRDIANLIIYYNESFGSINLANFLTYVKINNELADDIESIINNSFIKDLTLDNFKEYLATLKKWNRKEQLQKLNEKLKNENDINEKMAIIKEITKLKREV